MKSRILAILSLSLLALSPAWTQSADEFFHRGALHYLSGTNDLARQSVTNGLRLYPTDPKLTNLWELLNRKGGQQQQQSQDNKDQNNPDQQSKDQQSKDQQEQEQQKKEQQKKEEEQKKQEEQKAADSKKKQNEDKQGEHGTPDKEEAQDDKDGAPEAAKVMKMTPQQAMQFLDTLKAEEKNLPFRPILRTNRQQRVFKDW